MNRFDLEVNRRATKSLKWDRAENEHKFNQVDVQPLWLADMDFLCCKEIIAELQTFVAEGIFGYEMPLDDEEAIFIDWCAKKYELFLEPKNVKISIGVVATLIVCLKALLQENDAVLINEPVYHFFRNVIESNNYRCISSDLINENGNYTIDYDDVEQKIVKHHIKVYVICNPHNPIGRVWKKAELLKIAAICQKHDVVLISDEIHADLTLFGNTFTSILHVYRKSISLMSPSKTFNVAGARISTVSTYDDELREKVFFTIERSALHIVNSFSRRIFAVGYAKGAYWVSELIAYLEANYRLLVEYFQKNLPYARMSPQEGTYLCWIDLSSYYQEVTDMKNDLIHEARVGVDFGAMFGGDNERFIRLNFATNKAHLQKSLIKIDRVLQQRLKINEELQRVK